MQLGMIGLGRMGGNMVERLIKGGHTAVVYDRNPEAVARYAAMGATGASDVAELCAKLSGRKVVWIMVGPAGKAVQDVIDAVAPHLGPGDVIVEGGNSDYRDSMRRAAALRERGIEFVDCGTSGGVWGLANGYCLMVGGSDETFRHCEPLFRTLAPENGLAHVGPSGAGHYVKMIHNAIEYGMMQAYAEGYELLQAKTDFALDLHQIARVWNHGSVVRSWLNELAERAFAEDPRLDALKGYVDDSGYGRWSVREAVDLAVPTPVLSLSLMMRFRSRQPDSFAAKVCAALRNQFGGHAVKKS